MRGMGKEGSTIHQLVRSFQVRGWVVGSEKFTKKTFMKCQTNHITGRCPRFHGEGLSQVALKPWNSWVFSLKSFPLYTSFTITVDFMGANKLPWWELWQSSPATAVTTGARPRGPTIYFTSSQNCFAFTVRCGQLKQDIPSIPNIRVRSMNSVQQYSYNIPHEHVVRLNDNRTHP